MKYLLTITAFLAAQSAASERVNMVCKFDAIAIGYTAKVYSTNLILDDGELYNDDGSSGYNGKTVFGNGDFCYSFSVYDGSAYRELRSYSSLDFNKLTTWSLNTGNVSCTMTRGWGEEGDYDIAPLTATSLTAIKDGLRELGATISPDFDAKMRDPAFAERVRKTLEEYGASVPDSASFSKKYATQQRSKTH